MQPRRKIRTGFLPKVGLRGRVGQNYGRTNEAVKMQDRVKNEESELFTELNWQSIEKVKWVGGTEQWEEKHEGELNIPEDRKILTELVQQ